MEGQLTLKLSTATLPFPLLAARGGTLGETVMMSPWIPSCVLSSIGDRGERQAADEYATDHFKRGACYRFVVACSGVCANMREEWGVKE